MNSQPADPKGTELPFMSLSCHGRGEDKDPFDQILAPGILAVTRRAHCENSKQGPGELPLPALNEKGVFVWIERTGSIKLPEGMP